MLERSERQKIIINSICVTGILAVAFLAGLLIWRAGQLGAVQTTVSERFALGPFQLFVLSKQPLNGGYQATIGFLPGVLSYFVFWAILAVSYIFFRLTVRGPTSNS